MIDHTFFVVGLFLSRILFVIFVFVFEQRFANVAMNLISIKYPVSSSFEQPRAHDHVAAKLFQGKHTGAIGFEIVEVWHDGDIDAALDHQAHDNIFFQLFLFRILAGALRDDD